MSPSSKIASPDGADAVTRAVGPRALLADPRSHGGLLWLRFLVVGVLNSAFGYAVFAVFLLAGFWPGAALIAATAAGVGFNFQTSRRLVFRSRGRVARFIGIYAAALVLNWASLRALHGLGLPELEAQALLVLPIAAFSFFGQKWFVFTWAPDEA